MLTYLYDIQAGSSSTSHVDSDRLYQGTLGKVLNLLRHGSTEEQSLPLALRKDRSWGPGHEGLGGAGAKVGDGNTERLGCCPPEVGAEGETARGPQPSIMNMVCMGRKIAEGGHLKVGEDGTDVALKAHIDHAVSLIQGQVAADVEADHLLL